MAAITCSLLFYIKKMATPIIAHPTLYGCTYSLLANWIPNLGINVKWVDLKDTNKLSKAIDESVKIVYLETPSNPTLEIIDLKKG